MSYMRSFCKIVVLEKLFFPSRTALLTRQPKKHSTTAVSNELKATFGTNLMSIDRIPVFKGYTDVHGGKRGFLGEGEAVPVHPLSPSRLMFVQHAWLQTNSQPTNRLQAWPLRAILYPKGGTSKYLCVCAIHVCAARRSTLQTGGVILFVITQWAYTPWYGPA